MNKTTLFALLAAVAALVFAALYVEQCGLARVHEKDADLRAEIAKHVKLAEQANDQLVESLKHADDLQAKANAERERADELQRESAALKKAFKNVKRRALGHRPAQPLEDCDEYVQDLERECVEHVTSLTEAFDLQKATTEAVRSALVASREETAQERGARLLENERAQGWKKSAKKQRRQKILIGVGAGLGGVGLALGTVYVVRETGDR